MNEALKTLESPRSFKACRLSGISPKQAAQENREKEMGLFPSASEVQISHPPPPPPPPRNPK